MMLFLRSKISLKYQGRGGGLDMIRPLPAIDIAHRRCSEFAWFLLREANDVALEALILSNGFRSEVSACPNSFNSVLDANNNET